MTRCAAAGGNILLLLLKDGRIHADLSAADAAGNAARVSI